VNQLIKLDQVPLDYSYIAAVNKGMTDGSRWMLLLHGRGDSKQSYEILAKEINVTGVHFLALNAPFSMSMGFMEGYSWYDQHLDPNEEAYRYSIHQLKSTLSALQDQGIALADIFVLGFSQGGRMALDLLHELDAPLAGVVALSPRMSTFLPLTQDNKAILETPLFMAHGTEDLVIPYSETFEQVKRWQALSNKITFKAYDFGHEIDIMEIIDLRQWLNELI